MVISVRDETTKEYQILNGLLPFSTEGKDRKGVGAEGGDCSRISEKREGEISQKLCNFPDLAG